MILQNFRHCIKFSGVLVFLFVVAAAISSPVAAQEPPPSNPLPGFDPRFGIVNAFNNTPEANAAGAGWTRVIFRWDVIQPGGPSDWKPANVPDPLIEAELESGREVVGVLIGTPGWATSNGTSTAVPPLEFWGDFVFKLASQYKGRVNHWVIWNQPDVTDPAASGHTWDGSEEEYFQLLKEAYLKIKAVDPNMQVHIGGLTYTWDQRQGNSQYLARLMNAIARDPDAATNNYYFDAVTYHLYYNPIQILEVLTNVHSILDAHSQGNKPIWINETNAPPSEDFIEPPLGNPAFKVSLEEQSAFVVQAFALALAGGAERIAFYKMNNSREHPESIEPQGLLRGDNSRRPAFEAFRTVTTYFADVQQTSWLQQGSLFIVTLDRGGLTTTVLWNTATEPLSYQLNAIAPQALLIDEQGNSQTVSATDGVYTVELPGATCTNGDYCFIGGAPRLIVESGSPAQRAPLLPLSPPTPTLVAATAAPVDTPVPTETPIPPPPTLTPAPGQVQPTPVVSATQVAVAPANDAPPAPEEVPNPETEADSGPPPSDILPDPDLDPFAPETEIVPPPSAEATSVPPVTIVSIFRPERLLWLFLIGLLVFTVTYGIGLAIWYRLKR